MFNQSGVNITVVKYKMQLCYIKRKVAVIVILIILLIKKYVSHCTKPTQILASNFKINKMKYMPREYQEVVWTASILS